MADTEVDFCPVEGRRREAAEALEQTLRYFEETARGELLNWNQAGLFGVIDRNRDEQRELARVAARGAVAIMLAHQLVTLPKHIEVYVDLPKSPLADLMMALEAALPELRAVEVTADGVDPKLRRIAAALGAHIARAEAA